MQDNPQAPDPAAFALPDHRVVGLSGRDAVAFAQAQFMNDVTGLAPGHWQWSGWLTPKGRVVALFALLRPDPESVLLVLPDADPVTFAAALQRFVFRSKLVIAVREDLRVEGRFGPPDQARGTGLHGLDAGLELDAGADGGPRTLRIVPASTAAHDPTQVAAWAAFDLAHGLPRLPASQTDHWTPQQLSLERLRAFSVKKGCYPGQEIVARTHFLGKVKRGLALLQGDGAAMSAGDDLHAADGVLGHLVAVASGSPSLALAVVPLEHETQSLQVNGAAVSEVPLRAGLAR